MTPDWWGVGKVVLAVVLTLAFSWFMLIRFVEKVFKGCDNKSLKQINDEINDQVEQSETPGVDKLEPESPKQWRKKWGLGEK